MNLQFHSNCQNEKCNFNILIDKATKGNITALKLQKILKQLLMVNKHKNIKS